MSRETWDLAQRIRAQRQPNACRQRVRHPFSGKIVCGVCGRPYTHKVNSAGTKYQRDVWVCDRQLREGAKTCSCTRIHDDILREKWVDVYNEFVTKRPKGESVVAMEEVLAALRQQERELALLAMDKLISRETYETERTALKAQMRGIADQIAERREHRIPESEYEPITEFVDEKVATFLSKVIVTRNVVTFEFHNGVRISRAYSNGQAGNKKGWKNKKKEA